VGTGPAVRLVMALVKAHHYMAYIMAKAVPFVMWTPTVVHLIYIIVLLVTEEIVRLLITQILPIHLHV
jgi:hypothetical protein